MSAAEVEDRGVIAASAMILPGQWHFGDEPVLLRTLLGSCVAITVWHPRQRIGGICHFLLPSRRRLPNTPREGRYGDEALELLVDEQLRADTRPQDYVAHIYGGADTLADFQGTRLNIGLRNIEAGWALLERYGFTVEGVDVGDEVPRTVTMDLANGRVQVKRGRGRQAA